MKRGQIKTLSVILISFIIILTGSIFNMFSLTGKTSECQKIGLNLYSCPEGYSVVPNYNKAGCLYNYQCAVINCPEAILPECGYDKAPYPIFGWYSGNYCAFDYECVSKPECNFVPRPPWKCTGDDKVLTPVYNSDGCVKYYQCGEVFILGSS